MSLLLERETHQTLFMFTKMFFKVWSMNRMTFEFPGISEEKANFFLDFLSAVWSQNTWVLIFSPPFKCILKRSSHQKAYLSSGLRKTWSLIILIPGLALISLPGFQSTVSVLGSVCHSVFFKRSFGKGIK